MSRGLPKRTRLFVCPKTFATDARGETETGTTRGQFVGGTKRPYSVCGPNESGPAEAKVLFTGARGEK